MAERRKPLRFFIAEVGHGPQAEQSQNVVRGVGRLFDLICNVLYDTVEKGPRCFDRSTDWPVRLRRLSYLPDAAGFSLGEAQIFNPSALHNDTTCSSISVQVVSKDSLIKPRVPCEGVLGERELAQTFVRAISGAYANHMTGE